VRFTGNVMAIDPGNSSGAACYDSLVDGIHVVKLAKCDPLHPGPLVQQLRSILTNNDIDHVVVENVGHHRPGNSSKASTSFARHMGHVEAILTMAGVTPTWVLPNKWMKEVCGVLPRDSAPRKDAIYWLAREWYPELVQDRMDRKTGLHGLQKSTADAVALYRWAKQQR